MISTVDQFVPAHQDREHHCGSIEDDSGGQAAGDQEQEAGQGTGPGVEALLQELVRGVDPPTIEEGDEQNAENHHHQRLGQVDLDELHAEAVGLPGGSDEGDGAGLGGHDGEADQAPGKAAVPQEIAFDTGALPALIQTDQEDQDHVKGKDRPVENCHGVGDQ